LGRVHRRLSEGLGEALHGFEGGGLKLDERARELERKGSELQEHIEQAQKLLSQAGHAEEAKSELREAAEVLSTQRSLAADLTRSLASTKTLADVWCDISDAIDEGLVALESGRIVYANRRFEEMTGYPKSRIRSRKFVNLLPPDEALRLFSEYERLREAGSVPDRIETVILSKDGERIDVAISNWRMIFEGEREGLIIVCDIRERKETDRRLARYLEYIERIVGEQLEAVARARDIHEERLGAEAPS